MRTLIDGWLGLIWPDKLLSVILLSTTLAGCGHILTTASVATKPPPVSQVCLAFKPIYWSKNDTLETQKQARAHNGAGSFMCGWKP